MRTFLVLLLALCCTASEAPRVLCLATAGVNSNELWTAVDALTMHGYRVDIAGPAGVALEEGVLPDLDIATVRADGYRALLIPGGKSPAALEGDAAALALCRAFAADGRRIAAICHGPRLLAAAGLLRGRVMTGLHDLASERPEAWRAGDFGTYLDEAVVEDGNLITSRFPNDGSAFARRLLVRLAEQGGQPVRPRAGSVLVWAPKPLPGRDRYLLYGALPASGADIRVTVVRDAAGAEAVAEPALVVVIGLEGTPPPPADLAQRWIDAGAEIVADAGSLPLLTGIGLPSERLHPLPPDRRRAAAMLGGLGAFKDVLPAPPPPADAAIALADGCDGRVVAAAHAWLVGLGRRPLLVGPRAGWLRGLGGDPWQATATFADEGVLAADAIIVAPGGLWPEATPEDAARTAWLRARWIGGARVLAVGHDAWRIANGEAALAKKPVATSAQLLWSFAKGGARYSAAPVEATAERLVTARGFADCDQAFATIMPLRERVGAP